MSVMPRPIEWGSAEIHGPVHDYRERLILHLLKRHLQGRRVLDAGCGTGSLVCKLLDLGLDAWGVDGSFLGLRFLTSKAQTLDTAAQADVGRIPFSSAAFDAIVCGEVLEHLQDDALAVRGFFRLLKDDGICVITVPAHPELWSCADDLAGHQRRYTRASLRELFESNGFRVLSFHSWGFPLIRFYQRFFFRGYVRRTQTASTGTGLAARSIAWNWGIAFVSWLFSFDNLFLWSDWGVGYLVVAQKIAG
jgi:ubiquinone/menaquinone biosynthesis C-methylase UbiE